MLISAVLGRTGVARAAPFAYIPTLNDDGIWVIDTATDEVTAVIPPDAPIEEGGGSEVPRAYVPSGGGVWVVDTTTQMPIAKFATGGSSFAVTPDEDRLYVVNGGAPGSVSVLDPKSGEEIAKAQVGDSPLGIAASADGRRVFVVNTSEDLVLPPCDFENFLIDCDLPLSIIDTETNADAPPSLVPNVGGEGVGIATDQNGLVYIGHRLFDEFGQHNQPPQREFPGLLVLEEGGQFVEDIRVGDSPLVGAGAVAVKRDGSRAYVLSDVGVAVVDPVQAEVVAVVDVPAGKGIALNPAETRAYVVAGDAFHPEDEVIVIDTATNTVLDHIPVGPAPIAFGEFIWPRAERAAATPSPEASSTPAPTASITEHAPPSATPTPTTPVPPPSATATSTPATPTVASVTPGSGASGTSTGCAMTGSPRGGPGSLVIVLLIGLMWRVGNRARGRG